MLKCPRCESKQIIKNGIVFGMQRYKCKQCNHSFTKFGPQGKPMHLKLLTHSLYESGLSMREISKIIGVTAQSISRWIRKWHNFFIMEQGKTENLYRSNGNNIKKIIHIQDDEDYIVISNRLPNGANFYIVIEAKDEKI